MRPTRQAPNRLGRGRIWEARRPAANAGTMVTRSGMVKAGRALKGFVLTTDATAHPDVTEDAVLGGDVRLLQPARGYRAGLDADLLAAACDDLPGQRVIEAGCGAGGA